MARILCLGNNTEDTDIKTKQISADNNSACHGLLSDLDQVVSYDSYKEPGYYHSSIYDLEFGRLVDICNQFDCVILLDQPLDQWDDSGAFYKTLELFSKIHVPVEIINPDTKNKFEKLSALINQLTKNKSFCAFPFIELRTTLDHTTLCCRSDRPVTFIRDLKNFKDDINYNQIRSQMANGTMLPEYCSSCYQVESLGIASPRQQGSAVWAARLGLTSIDDFLLNTSPVYYEINPGNKCNLQCRMCSPGSSHLIEKEYRRIGLWNKPALTKEKFTGFDVIDFDTVEQVYIAGGEPTAMPEFYQFLDRCIELGKTDIEIVVNTNGTKLSKKFKQQLKHFSKIQFLFSIDGYKDLNYYIRWPSNWDTIINNLKYLKNNGYSVTINNTVSIYNIARLYQLFEFIDNEFPNTLILCQIAENLSPFMYPDKQAALDSLNRIKTMNCYKNNKQLANSINGYSQWFENNLNSLVDLKKFFEFNNLLDRSRNIQLKDYLPELDPYRY